MDAVGEIKSRLQLEDVVAEYLELKRSGSNLKALSPFTQEKTASFMVSPAKQIWHDFSSNKGGDMITFIQEMEGVEFKEALVLLARKAGVELTQYQSKSSLSAEGRSRLEQANLAAARFYQQQLLSSKIALEYITKKRGFKRQVVEDFHIGYAPPSGKALNEHLLKNGYRQNELIDAGLAVKRSGGVYDMFRDRVLVALGDRQGKIIGFTGRIIKDTPNAPKYLNTAQTKLYDKSRHVFGLHLAKSAIRDNDLGIMVEGNMDVVSAHQAGFKNVVATAGTALTTQQLRQLKYLSANVAFAFDADDAGLRATIRAIPLAQAEDMKLYVISVPDGKDPDDIISRDPKHWQKLIDNKIYAVDWVINYYASQHDLMSATGKSGFVKQAVKVLEGIADPVEQEHYIKLTAKNANSSVAAVQKQMSKQSVPTRRKANKAVEVSAPPQFQVIAQTLLALTLTHPSARMVLTSLPTLDQENTDVVLQSLKKSKANADDLIKTDLKDQAEFVKILQLIGEEQFSDWSSADSNVEADQLVLRLNKLKIEQDKKQLSQQIAQAEEDGDNELAEELLGQWQKLNQED